MKKTNKKILLATIAVMLSMGIATALEKTITLETVPNGCLGTDCEYMSEAIGTVTIDDCRDKLYMDVSLNGIYVNPDLGQSNYQITIQTYSGDKRLDSTGVCANPNAPMGGSHPNAWECGGWSDYSFYNFEMDALTTDGTFHKSYEITLPEGCYDVALLVKHDKVPEGTGGANYPIVLQKGHITFCVVGYCTSQQEERISNLEKKVEELQKEDIKIWDKLHGVQDEISGLKGYIDSEITELKNYLETKLTEIWNKLTSVQGEIANINNKLGKFENCNSQDKKYCNGNIATTDDYYCEAGFGTDTMCSIEHCKLIKTENVCQYGCSNGVCLPPPTTTTTIPPTQTQCWTWCKDGIQNMPKSCCVYSWIKWYVTYGYCPKEPITLCK